VADLTLPLTAVQQFRCVAYRIHLCEQTGGPAGFIAPTTDRLLMQDTYFGSDREGYSVWERVLQQWPWMADTAWVDNGSVETLFFGRPGDAKRHFETEAGRG
jgi:hypothetical protein